MLENRQNSSLHFLYEKKSILLSGIALIFSFPVSQALANVADADETGVAERSEQRAEAIIVTGSRIRGVAPVGSNLIGVDATAIEKSGAVTVADVLRQVPQVTSLGINSEGGSGAGASSNITKASGPNLRGIGSAATLVVLDGKRLPVAGTQGNFIDPSFLPSLAIQRLEVIADGASAIYGSDAVAGVINLIPQKNYTGLQMRARAGLADGYHEYQVSGLGGADWGSGNIVLAVEWTRNNSLLANERDFVSSDRRYGGGGDARSISCAPGTISANGTTYALPATGSGTVNFATLTPGTANRCDIEDAATLIPTQKRLSVYGYLSQNLHEDLKIFAQGVYSRRTFSGVLNGQSVVANIVVPRTNAFYPTNVPSSTNIAVSTNFMDVMGPQLTQGTSKTYQALAGVEANIGNWELRFSGSYGESSDEEDRSNGVNAAALNAALASSNPAVAINPFYPMSNSRSRLESIYLERFNPEMTNRLYMFSAEANGALFHLPGGDVRMALGAEYRNERASGVYIYGSALAPARSPTNIGRSVKALFAELYVPLFGPENAMAGFDRLDLLAAIRHEDYSDFGTTTNPKIGLTWRPFEGVSLRGSYGTSFRAPGLAEIDPNSSGAGIRTRNYTVAGSTLPLTMVVLAAGNPTLQPEKATTWSAGVDITPASLPSLRFSATYFNIRYERQVVDAYTIVPQILAEPQNFSDIVFLNNGGAAWQNAVNWLASTQYYQSGSVNFALANGIVDARKQNLGTTKTDGMDFEANYQFGSDSNHFNLAANATLFFNYENSTGGSALVSRLNTYGYPQKFRVRSAASWTNGPASVQATLNYLGHYKNRTSSLVQSVSSYTTVDLDLGYTFEDGGSSIMNGLRLGLNVRNLFDREPPFVDAALGYDPSSASALGRIVSLSLSKSF